MHPCPRISAAKSHGPTPASASYSSIVKVHCLGTEILSNETKYPVLLEAGYRRGNLGPTLQLRRASGTPPYAMCCASLHRQIRETCIKIKESMKKLPIPYGSPVQDKDTDD
jgi:hypothetical protein